MKLAIDLFTGSGSFEKVARRKGYDVISVDNRRRKGICEPTIRTDISKMRSSFFKGMNPKVIWAGIPCDIWSNASGGLHLDINFQPKTEKAEKHLNLFYNTLDIIDESETEYFFLENPRGKMDKYPGLKKWLEHKGGKIFYCTLSSYGFPTTKPTMIATNYAALNLKPMDSFGRGAKNKVPGAFNNMTKAQRQKTPPALITSILNQIEK